MSISIAFDGPLATAILDYAKATGVDTTAAVLELTTTGVVRRRALADHEVIRLTESGGAASPRAVKAAAVAKALSAVAPGVGRRIPSDPAAREAARQKAEKEMARIQARLAKLGPVATMPTVTSKALDQAQGSDRKGKR